MLSQKIAEQFCQTVVKLDAIGNGLINDTLLVETEREPFVLQKINRHVFPNPELIMANLTVLNQYVASLDNNENSLKIPELLQTQTGAYFVLDDRGDYWRAWTYLGNTDCLESLNNLAEAEQVGVALGKFHRLGHGLDPDLFHDTLLGFHITPKYFEFYQKVKENTLNTENAGCRDFIEQHQHIINDLEDAKALGQLSMRVTHGDPKLNNFLFDKVSRQIVSLIDLDTVKPGLIHYDIGDCLRSCCHNHDENSFDLAICQAILTGYAGEMQGLLTEYDYQYLYSAIRLIPFELGLRFYTDYLDDNKYFKVAEPEENLIRAKAQFDLCANIQTHSRAIEAMIACLKAA